MDDKEADEVSEVEAVGDAVRVTVVDGLLTADGVAEDDSVPLAEALIVFERLGDSLAESDALDDMLREGDDEALNDKDTLELSLLLDEGLVVTLKELLAVSDDETVSVELADFDELEEGVAEGDCVPEELPLEDPDSVALLLPEVLPVMVMLSVPLKEALVVSDTETVPLAEGDRLSAGVIVAVEDGDWLDDPLPDKDMLMEPEKVADDDGRELAETDSETDPLSDLVSLPLPVEEGVDVSLDDSLRELDDDPVLLGVPVELAEGKSDALDDPVEDAERLPLSEEVLELLREALSVPEPDDVSLAVWL